MTTRTRSSSFGLRWISRRSSNVLRTRPARRTRREGDAQSPAARGPRPRVQRRDPYGQPAVAGHACDDHGPGSGGTQTRLPRPALEAGLSSQARSHLRCWSQEHGESTVRRPLVSDPPRRRRPAAPPTGLVGDHADKLSRIQPMARRRRGGAPATAREDADRDPLVLRRGARPRRPRGVRPSHAVRGLRLAGVCVARSSPAAFAASTAATPRWSSARPAAGSSEAAADSRGPSSPAHRSQAPASSPSSRSNRAGSSQNGMWPTPSYQDGSAVPQTSRTCSAIEGRTIASRAAVGDQHRHREPGQYVVAVDLRGRSTPRGLRGERPCSSTAPCSSRRGSSGTGGAGLAGTAGWRRCRRPDRAAGVRRVLQEAGADVVEGRGASMHRAADQVDAGDRRARRTRGRSRSR